MHRTIDRAGPALLCALSTTCGGGQEPAAPLPYNLVLITVDTLRADHLGCYGYPRDTSPNVDLLARNSVLFEQALVQWPKTGPSISSLMTSTYGSTSGVMRATGKIPVPAEYDLLAEVLQRHGYETLAVVTNASLSSRLGYSQGFERYVENYQGNLDLAPSMTASAIGLLGQRDEARPFFLWIHYADPHSLYEPPEEHLGPFLEDLVYRDDRRPPVPVAPEALNGTRKKESTSLGTIDGNAYLEGLDRPRDYVARYDGEIHYLDEHLGKLFQWMAPRDLLGDTVIVFTADHGESLGDHEYWFHHGKLPYDDCVRVPLLLCHPELAPRTVPSPVALLDLAPTVLESLGVPAGWQSQGRSLFTALQEDRTDDLPPVFTESGYDEDFSVSVRVGRYKLIHVGSERLAALLTGESYELYDVEADPGETRNLVSTEEAVFQRLRTLLDPFVEQAYRQRDKGPAPAVTLDPEELENLDELGYVDGR